MTGVPDDQTERAAGDLAAEDSGEPRITLEGARSMVTEFRRVRDRFRGQLAAPESELVDPPELIGKAIGVWGESLGPMARGSPDQGIRAELQRLVEDSVDLQSFRPDDEAELLRTYKPGSGPRPAGAAETDADRAWERLNMARATQIHRIRGDFGAPAGAAIAMRQLARPVVIGDAQVGMNAASSYRAGQAGAYIGCLAWAPMGAFIVVFLHPPALVIAALVVGWFLVGPLVCIGAFRIAGTLESRWPTMPGWLGLPIVAATFLSPAIAALAVAAGAWWIDGVLFH